MAGDLPISKAKVMLFWSIFFALFVGFGAGIGAIVENIVVGLIIGGVAGAIFSSIILFGMSRTNKNVRFQYGASSYVRNGSYHIDFRKDIYLYSQVSKTARASSREDN